MYSVFIVNATLHKHKNHCMQIINVPTMTGTAEKKRLVMLNTVYSAKQ